MDASSVVALAERTRVIATTVGPYTTLGAHVVAACAQMGTDYVDLGGDAAWIAAQIRIHNATAARTGARLVLAAGFGALPFDLGVLYVQRQARRCFGRPAPHVRCRVDSHGNGYSGGTIAASRAKLRAVVAHPSLYQLYSDPYALARLVSRGSNHNAKGTMQKAPAQAAFPPDPVAETRVERAREDGGGKADDGGGGGGGDHHAWWMTPMTHMHFVYYQVYLTAALLPPSESYGDSFVYEQQWQFAPAADGGGVSKAQILSALTQGDAFSLRDVLNISLSATDVDEHGQPLLAHAPLTLSVWRYFDLFMRYTAYDYTLAPGSGDPGDPHGVEARAQAGYYTDLRFSADWPSQQDVAVRATLHIADDAYVATARFMIETAICLAHGDGCTPRARSGGFYSPAAALGEAFVRDRLPKAHVNVSDARCIREGERDGVGEQA